MFRHSCPQTVLCSATPVRRLYYDLPLLSADYTMICHSCPQTVLCSATPVRRLYYDPLLSVDCTMFCHSCLPTVLCSATPLTVSEAVRRQDEKTQSVIDQP
eukprot:8409107-Pyramimonas_sp.AAC.1